MEKRTVHVIRCRVNSEVSKVIMTFGQKAEAAAMIEPLYNRQKELIASMGGRVVVDDLKPGCSAMLVYHDRTNTPSRWYIFTSEEEKRNGYIMRVIAHKSETMSGVYKIEPGVNMLSEVQTMLEELCTIRRKQGHRKIEQSGPYKNGNKRIWYVTFHERGVHSDVVEVEEI